jgi:hypothetical protein
VTDLDVTWRGVTLGSDLIDIDVEKITGWDDLTDVVDLSQARARGHGEHVGELFAAARIVTVSGSISSRQTRDLLARTLLNASPVSSAVEDLTIETFGRRLTAGARIVRRSLPVEVDYASGSVPFSIQWRCPNPLRYGQAQSASTGLPTDGGGLAWPLFSSGHLDWGTAGTSGQITLDNRGTADAAITLQVVGGTTHGLEKGWEISAAGSRITYPTRVPPGQPIHVDTAAGTVLAEGTADRRAELTHADWLLVPAARIEPDGTSTGGSLTLQFTSLGGAYDPTTRLHVQWKETSW